MSRVRATRELYVGLTLHRKNATLVVERDRLDAAVRSPAETTKPTISEADLHARLFVEARRYSEKANVVAFVEDRTAFVRTDTTPATAREGQLNLRHAFMAGRALRSVMKEIGAAASFALWQLPRILPVLSHIPNSPGGRERYWPRRRARGEPADRAR